MNILHSTLSSWRDKFAPISHTSTFRTTGQITPEEFVAAGDYLVYKFPTWSWADASPAAKRVAYLPPGKQFLVTRGVPCHRRLDENFAGEAGVEENMVRDGFERRGGDGSSTGGAGGAAGSAGDRGGEPADDDDGWLRTGGLAASQEARVGDVRTVDESGEVGEREEDDEDEIPDMEDEEDDEEAIIRDPKGGSGTTAYVFILSLFVCLDSVHYTKQPFPSSPSTPPSLTQKPANSNHQSPPNIHPLHNLHPLLSHPAPLPLRLHLPLNPSSPAPDDARHHRRLQGQDRHARGFPLLRRQRQDGLGASVQARERDEDPARPCRRGLEIKGQEATSREGPTSACVGCGGNRCDGVRRPRRRDSEDGSQPQRSVFISG